MYLNPNAKDISGRRFGRLVPISPTDLRKAGSVVWRCACDCGNEVFVATRELSLGLLSCGCLRAAMSLTKDLCVAPKKIPHTLAHEYMAVKQNNKLLSGKRESKRVLFDQFDLCADVEFPPEYPPNGPSFEQMQEALAGLYN